jgi:trigger factor
LNIQTERLDNHTAQFTVEVPAERLEKGKQQAARRLSGRVNIPGFRKGKAPYSIIVRYFGEPAIIEDAFEIIGNDVYREALAEIGVEPYGPGNYEKYDAEKLTMTFTVPLAPEVTLGDYRAVRLSYEVPAVTDEDVEKTLKTLQEQNATSEAVDGPAELGHRVTVDIHGVVAEDHKEEDAAESGEDHDHDHTVDHDDPNLYAHEHDAQLILDADHEPIPGFAAALVGATAGEVRNFDIVGPEGDEDFEDVAGKTVHFTVTVKQIESVVLPELDDALAAKLTANEEKPLTLAELRERVQANLVRINENRFLQDYSRRALDAMVETATVAYPQQLLADEVDEMKEQFDQNLRQQGFTLKDYMKVMNRTDADMFEEYRPTAELRVKRGLVMREIMKAEGINAGSEELIGEIETMLEPVAEENRDQMRKVLEDPKMRLNVLDDLLRRKTTERIVAIARGEAPELVKDDGAAEEVKETVEEDQGA